MPPLPVNDSHQLFHRPIARSVIHHNRMKLWEFGNLSCNGMKTIDRQVNGAIVNDNDPNAPNHLFSPPQRAPADETRSDLI
jgi:hypothetical protein